MNKYIFLIIGGSIGTISRYLLSTWALQKLGLGLPFGTLIVNLIGCFIIGLIAGLPQYGTHMDPAWRLLLVVGFLGGLTTFSSYEFESFILLQEGYYVKALLNLCGSVFLGLLAVLFGFYVVRFSIALWGLLGK